MTIRTSTLFGKPSQSPNVSTISRSGAPRNSSMLGYLDVGICALILIMMALCASYAKLHPPAMMGLIWLGLAAVSCTGFGLYSHGMNHRSRGCLAMYAVLKMVFSMPMQVVYLIPIMLGVSHIAMNATAPPAVSTATTTISPDCLSAGISMELSAVSRTSWLCTNIHSEKRFFVFTILIFTGGLIVVHIIIDAICAFVALKIRRRMAVGVNYCNNLNHFWGEELQDM